MHPVLFHLGPLYVFSYGALIALGGALSCRFWHGRRHQMGLRKDEDFWLLVNVILFGGFIGGRVMFLLEYTSWLSPDFWNSLVSFSKGFSVMGAFLGVTSGLWWFSRRVGAPPARVFDYVCQAAPFWHAFGRLGCFMAGCCYGRPTDLPWGVRFTDARAMVEPSLKGVPIHPTQLYEALGDLVIAALLYKVVLKRTEEGRLPNGTVACAYFFLYGILRFVTEYFRGDTVAAAAGVTAAQAFSLLFMFGACGIYLYISRRRTAAAAS